MSLSEARHADQLVAGGGAYITSDCECGAVGQKATTPAISPISHYPGFWAYLGMTFLLLTSVSCQPVMGIEANIFPESAIIEVGTDLSIRCILRNESGAGLEIPTSSDIVWYKNQDIIPSEEYHILNDTTSSISIVDANLTDSATYYCLLIQDTDVNDYLSSTVQVGYKPQPVLTLNCASNNILDYTCEWDPVPTHIINESHTFEFIYERKWKACPDLRPPNKCFISRYEHSGSTQEVKVTSSNDLGDDAAKTVYFNPDTETIPLPPSNVALTSRGSTVLEASWELPVYWELSFRSLLTYRLRWASQKDPENWLGPLTSETLSCEIRQLEPYTKYVVEVASKVDSSVGDWGDWSDPVEARTDEAAPIGTVQNLQTSDLNGTSDYGRSVLISWEMMPEEEQRGPILGYSVRVVPHSSCLDQQIFNGTVNSTEVIVEGLEKFCAYTVKITAFNSIGPGPVEDEEIEDMTTNPLPPSIVRAETQSHRSVLVSWNKPTPVKGYISYYTVHWIQTRGQDQGQSKQVPPSNLSYRVDDLEGFVLYSFKVSVTNRMGVSGWSREAKNTTDEWIPKASPTNLTVEPVSNNPHSLLVNWIDISEEDAHGQIQGHYLYYCRVAEESLLVNLCSLNVSDCLDKRERETFSKTAQKPVALTGVDPFSHYLIWVSAFTSVGNGPLSWCPSSGRTSEGTPSQPLNVNVTSSSASSIGLTWSPPLEKNGIIRNYTILVKSNASSDQQEFYAGGVQSYLVEGLYGYIHYTLQVRACTITCGAASDEVYQKTEIGVPEQPENLNIQPSSHNQVILSWDPPIHPNGPINHYLVSYRHQQPSTPHPVVIHVRSASTTTTLANSIDEWLKTTELTMKMEVDCSQAPFLFQVVAVNVISDSPSVGEAVESVLSECIELETTLSPLIWLILPGGVILLFALLTSLYYVQSKLGKSWPDPVYTDMVKNKMKEQPVPRPKRAEKEEFDTIPIVCPPDMEEVIVAEEYPSQPYQCPVHTSMTIALTSSLDIKSDVSDKQAYLRTVSIDSGVPPSPQDHLDFSSSEDVFHAEDYDTTEWIDDTYSNPKVIVCHASSGRKGGHFPPKSVSLSSSDGVGLPAIEEDKCMDPIVEKVSGDKGTIAVGAYTSTQGEWLDDDEEDDEDDDINDGAYSRISKLSSPLKQPQVPVKDQSVPINQNKLDGPAEGHTENRTAQPISSSDSGNHSMASDSGYVSNDMTYLKFGFNEVTQETTFKSKPEDDYVPGPMTYSVLAIPQVGQQPSRPSDKSNISNYVSEESLAYTKFGMTPDVAGKESIMSDSSTVALVEQPLSQPCVPTEGIGYVKLRELSSSGKNQEDAGTEEPQESSWNDIPLPSPSPRLSDYVRGVDLHKMLENESELSKSSDSPASPICIPGEMGKGELQDLPEVTLDETKRKQSREKKVRSRTDSSSSSSGYGSDNRGQVSGYVVVSNQPKEKSDNYANLAFTSSESETDSDVDAEKSVRPEDAHEISKCVKSISDNAGDTSFVEYVSNDSFGVGFVNDYPSPSKGNDGVGLSHSMTPCLHSKGLSSSPQGHENGGCEIIPGYVSHNAVLGAETKSNSMLDIYQVPSKDCREFVDGTGHESGEGDDGYVPFCGDSGYVLQVLDGNQTKELYMPMSPIARTRIEEDCL